MFEFFSYFYSCLSFCISLKILTATRSFDFTASHESLLWKVWIWRNVYQPTSRSSHLSPAGCKLAQLLMRTLLGKNRPNLQKHLSIDPWCSIHRNVSYKYPNTYAKWCPRQFFPSKLFMMAKDWQEPKYLTIRNWFSSQWNIYSMEECSRAVTENKGWSQWPDLERLPRCSKSNK